MESNAIKFGEAELTLEQLANADLSSTAEKRRTRMPRGTFVFVIDGTEPPQLRKQGDGKDACAGMNFGCKVEEVIDLKDKAEFPDPNELIGKMHFENFYLRDDEAVGYLTAFLVDIGVGKGGTINALGLASVGKRFQGTITHARNKNDEDKPYINLSRDKGKIIALG